VVRSADPGRPASLERHGNPNVPTPDRGTSRLAQGCSCNSTLVRIRRIEGRAPAR
jgi:biotin/methionine sulfoxide reductase